MLTFFRLPFVLLLGQHPLASIPSPMREWKTEVPYALHDVLPLRITGGLKEAATRESTAFP